MRDVAYAESANHFFLLIASHAFVEHKGFICLCRFRAKVDARESTYNLFFPIFLKKLGLDDG